MTIVRRPFFVLICGLWTVVCGLIGCAPTYKGTAEQSIIGICKKEYNIDVRAQVAGNTVAVYLPLPSLFDLNMGLTKEAIEKLNDVQTTISRVTFSTDPRVDFYCLITNDIRIPELQIIWIGYVEDIKRVKYLDIAQSEANKRHVLIYGINPQAKKERAVQDVFEKMSIDKKWQDQVMDDFFRSEPTTLSDIGYWNDNFYIKDISMPEFLAEQIVNRIRIVARDDKKIEESFSIKNAKGSYVSRGPGKKYFKIEVLAAPNWLKNFDVDRIANQVFRMTADISAHVFHSYKFEDFDHIEMTNQLNGKTVDILREDLERLRTKKMKFEDLVK